METITDIFRTYGPEYIECYGDAMPKEHHKVINAIINCRTQCYGIAVYQCEQCGQVHRVFRSCGNRHCPACQNHKARQWLEKHLKPRQGGAGTSLLDHIHCPGNNKILHPEQPATLL